jgi:asparagine synthase (glutamine-hydrolysing)
VELTDELDVLGATAADLLRREGVRWPANGYMHVPLLERARGGSLLTGVGGDELFGTRGARHVLVVRRRERLRPRDLRSFAAVALPRRARAWWWRRTNTPTWPWLTPAGSEVLGRALAREEASWPHRWDASVRHWYRSRAYAGIQTTLAGVARERDVAVVSPFAVPTVLAELAAAGGPTGFDSRSSAMHQLFGALLPEAVLTRATKAEFTGALWGPAVRGFASEWTGAGVDERWVDVEALRREWHSEQPDFRTVLLLHKAWTEAQRRPSPEDLE